MADKTEKQELGSITAFYYAIEKGANLGTIKEPAITLGSRDENLYNDLLLVYPDMEEKWYKTFLKQAIVLINWLGHTQGQTDTSYNYGRFGTKSILSIPSSSTSTLGDWMWDSLSKDQKQLYGSNPKKDSWNPMDVYIVKKRDEDGIKGEITESISKNRVGEDVEAAAIMEMQSLNEYLAYYTNKHVFVGISLKETDYGEPKVTENNLKKSFDHIHPSNGEIYKSLNMNMTVLGSKTKMVKGKLVDKGMDFQTNSLTYEATFNIGNYIKSYKYESKISSVENHATEPRDRVKGAGGGYTNAKARNGAVPAPKMAKIVKEYSGQEINANIPLKGNFSEQDKKAMVKLLNSIKSGGNTTAVQKPFDFNIHLDKKSGKYFSRLSAKEYVDKLVELDNDFQNKTDKFPKALRSKFRAARYILMFQKAEEESESRLSTLIAEIYFASSKINMSKDDLSGPFIKIQ